MEQHVEYNREVQWFRNVPLKLIVYTEKHFSVLKAKRFMIHGSTQNLWIPNKFLTENGTIRDPEKIAWIFSNKTTQHKLELAGIKLDPAPINRR